MFYCAHRGVLDELVFVPVYNVKLGERIDETLSVYTGMVTLPFTTQRVEDVTAVRTIICADNYITTKPLQQLKQIFC